MSRDFRNSRRRRIFKVAAIEYGERAVSTVACTVRNISDTGASVDLNSPLWFPDEFTLVIESDGLRKPGRVAWRNGRKVGIQFTACRLDTSAGGLDLSPELRRSHPFA